MATPLNPRMYHQLAIRSMRATPRYRPASLSVAASRLHTTAPPRTRAVPSELTSATRLSGWSFKTDSIFKKTSQRRNISATPTRKARAIANPRKNDEGEDMVINITPRAANRLQSISENDNNPDLALRVAVESGGCHGFQYLMSLVNISDIDTSEDTLFENEDVAKKTGTYKAKVVMDEPSLELLSGSSIDYTMELIGSQFKVTGIPGAKSSCGCGTSFDVA